ncbi:hypothetical protein [Pseudomonas sp. MWU12-3103b]|uniref:hypothetical protein n=1 Tax=Pseudomonas sp. MWU12-3103b TaxID=2928857 RepID=UPI001FFE81CD|nr:hypothetical protein [Pseudomonas sp. MWU12-3103b]
MKIFKADPSYWFRTCETNLGFIDSLFVKQVRHKPDFLRRMFDEDFARLFHPRNRRNGNLFQIVSNDDGVMQKLLGNVQLRRSRRSVDETIYELVTEIAKTLIWCGEAHYLIFDDTENGGVGVASFNSQGVLRLFGRHIQWVPKRNERHWDRENIELPREIRILDSAKVMRFEVPKTIKRMLTTQNRTLKVLDKYQFIRTTDFHLPPTHENPNPTNHFDFEAWSDIQDISLYRATRSTGWNGRKYDASKRSDFFDCHRMIRFRRNQLSLRDAILYQLGNELSRIGKNYTAEFSIKISATDQLPSVAYLDELTERLAAEKVGFTEIIDYCYKQ